MTVLPLANVDAAQRRTTPLMPTAKRPLTQRKDQISSAAISRIRSMSRSTMNRVRMSISF
jgi:hypothetical protein